MDDTEREVKAALKRGDVGRALDILKDARSIARSNHNAADAGDYSAWMASLHLGEGRIELALHEFEAAERDEPANMYHKLTTAEQLLWSAGRPMDSLQKLDEIPVSSLTNPSVIHSYHATRGEAYARLGKIDEAVKEFRLMSDPALVARVRVESLTVELVSQLAKVGAAHDECVRYLAAVKSKPAFRGDSDLGARIAKLEETLGN